MALETTREIEAKIEGIEKRQKEEEEERRRRRKRTGNIYFIPTSLQSDLPLLDCGPMWN